VKPSPFEYYAPTTVDECVALLAEHGEDAKLLAGGQSLVPLMNLRLAAPEVVIDLNRVAGLVGARVDDGQLVIGAMTRHRDVAGAPEVRAACPMLAHAAGMIGYPPIRARGTLAGSLAHADPASELPCVAVTLDAELVALGPAGRRVIPARDFFVSHFTTALEPAELLLEVRFPRRADGDGWEFLEFTRKSGDFAVAAVAVELRRGGGARIGVAGVGDRPWRATEAEQALAAEAGPAAREAAAEGAARQATGFSDGYRANVVGALTRRALATAVDRMGE
jgi:aerobic carbon-monoxide dehydrogenase medium subunit